MYIFKIVLIKSKRKMKTKIYSALFLFAILMGSLSYAAIPVKRELVKNQMNSNVEFVDSFADSSATEQEADASASDIDWTAFLLCWFLGIFGAHRFYLGHTGIAIAQLLTLGGLGIWSFIDLIRIATGSLT